MPSPAEASSCGPSGSVANDTAKPLSVWPVSGAPDRVAGGRIPQPHRAVVAGGREQGLPVGQSPERHRVDPAGVAGELAVRWAERVGPDWAGCGVR
jgi:hypothetical protein